MGPGEKAPVPVELTEWNLPFSNSFLLEMCLFQYNWIFGVPRCDFIMIKWISFCSFSFFHYIWILIAVIVFKVKE